MSLILTGLLAVVVVVTAGSGVMVSAPWVVRGLALGAEVATVVLLVRGGRSLLLLSPLFLLATSAVLFYSVVIALGAAWLLDDWETLWFIPAYLGQRAEGLVLQFAGLCLCVTTALAVVVPVSPDRGPDLSGRLARSLAVAAAVIALVYWGLLSGQDRGAVIKALHDAALPVLAALVATLAERGGRLGGGAGRLFLAAAAAVVVLLFAGGDAKTATFIGSAGCGVYLVRGAGRLGGMRTVWIGTGVVLAVTTGVAIATMARYGPLHRDPGLGAPTMVDRLMALPRTLVVSKIMWRQAETGACLQGVVDRHLATSNKPSPPPEGEREKVIGSAPVYFLTAVVPRALWPDKPSLSNGRLLGVAYCRQPETTIHDASVTLLGEPLIRGGPVGLAAAGGTLLLLLGAVTVGALRGGRTGLVGMGALLPWMVDFDQSFALYLANAVKMGLIVAAVLLGLRLWMALTNRSHPEFGG
ncbi:MAG: hypothetical protein H7840_00705 [Alphaproteobacteria bacterium]